MKNNLKIYLLIILGFGFINAFAQNVSRDETTVLYTDRDFCVSGDTVWFKVFQPKQFENLGNILHIQLDNRNNILISTVAVKIENGWAQGFISIPDSLGTGQYFITAFLNAQRNIADLETTGKSLLVYNRFEERIEEMELIQTVNQEKNKTNNLPVYIITDKENYLTREKVLLKIDLNPDVEIKNAIIKASLVDPLSHEIEFESKFKLKSPNPQTPNFIEYNGILLSGKVTDRNGIAQSDALVLLSISGDQPYFDYYYLNENGDFHFYVKNAFGTGNIVLQVVSNNQKQYFIQLQNNYMMREEVSQLYIKKLKYEQIEFINTAISANFSNKIFNPSFSVQPLNFEMPARFTMPFYGEPSQHIIPDEFINLPDFQEISREILPGLQYRFKKDETTIRVVDRTHNLFFEDEPLRLINGVPVFKNELFANLKSADISYIDLVKSERIFGDMVFKGVLAVSLYDKSNSWMAQQPNIFQFNVSFIQPAKLPCYSVQNNLSITQPDMRQVFLWQVLEPGSKDTIDFILSDRKGMVEITVEGFTTEKEFFTSSKLIEIK